MKNKIIMIVLLLSTIVLFSGCASTHPPLTYLALEKPKGAIHTTVHKELDIGFFRGGWYVLNENFRPAADIKAYIEAGEQEANTKILRNVDIKLNVPGAIDIFFFGYNGTTDHLVSTK